MAPYFVLIRLIWLGVLTTELIFITGTDLFEKPRIVDHARTIRKYGWRKKTRYQNEIVTNDDHHSNENNLTDARVRKMKIDCQFSNFEVFFLIFLERPRIIPPSLRIRSVFFERASVLYSRNNIIFLKLF